MTDSLPFAPSAERNLQPILAALRGLLGREDRVLEIGSGTGQHVTAFAKALPGVQWLPSELNPHATGLIERVRREGSPNIHAPLSLDVAQSVWLTGTVDACLTINTLHIMSWEHVVKLFAKVGQYLTADGQLLVYGPMRVDGAHTGPGNEAFDASLRASDASQGIRDIGDLDRLATCAGLGLQQVLPMPADNRLCVWRLNGPSRASS